MFTGCLQDEKPLLGVNDINVYVMANGTKCIHDVNVPIIGKKGLTQLLGTSPTTLMDMLVTPSYSVGVGLT